MKPEDRRDKLIMEDFRSGKLAALYHCLYPSLMLYARKFLYDTDDGYYAEDFVQNAIYRAWKRRTSFDTIAGLKSFLYTVVRNDCLSHLRKAGARDRYVSSLATAGQEAHEGMAMDADVAGIIFGTLSELPPRERIVLELGFFEGKSTGEIARLLDLSYSAVKKRKARALDMLRQRLDPMIL